MATRNAQLAPATRDNLLARDGSICSAISFGESSKKYGDCPSGIKANFDFCPLHFRSKELFFGANLRSSYC